MSSITSSSHSPYPGRLFVVTSSESSQEREGFSLIKSHLANRGGGEIKEIKIENKKYLREAIETQLPKDKKLQTPCLFINSEYIGTYEELEQFSRENDLKHILLNSKQQDPGPLLKVYRNQNDIVSVMPPRLYFPKVTKPKVISHILKLTNLSDSQYVIYKMKTNNYKPYSVHPRQGLIPPGEVCEITVHLKEGFGASPSDKFRLEGVTLPYADESYIHEIEKIFQKLKDKIVKQLVPLDSTRPDGVVVEDQDNAILVEWRHPAQHAKTQETVEVQQKESEENKETPSLQEVEKQTGEEIGDESKPSSSVEATPQIAEISEAESSKTTAASEGATDSEPISEVVTPKAEEPRPKVEESIAEEQRTDIEESKVEEPRKKTDVQAEPPVIPTIPETPVEISVVESLTSDSEALEEDEPETDELLLQSLSQSTKQELDERERESEQSEQIIDQRDQKALETLRLDYNNSLQEISRLMEVIRTLEVKNNNMQKELHSTKESLGRKEKEQYQEGLRQRNPVKEKEELVPEPKQKEITTQPHSNASLGFPLTVVILIAIICFLLGNILS